MSDFTIINLIEKFILFLIVATIFVFCFWQEYDEKKRAGHFNNIISLETSILIWGLIFGIGVLLIS